MGLFVNTPSVRFSSEFSLQNGVYSLNINGTSLQNQNGTLVVNPTAFLPNAPLIAYNSGALPSGVTAQVPIVITAPAGSDISANTPIPIELDTSTYSSYLNSTNSNYQFSSDTGNGNPLYSWYSGTITGSTNPTIYVKIPIQISAGTTYTIYLNFLAKSVTWNGTYNGAYPNATSTYAEYDNGSDVFPLYANFSGTSTPTGWTESEYSQDNGITSAGGLNDSYMNYTASTFNPQNYIINAFANFDTASNDSYYAFIGWATTENTYINADSGYVEGITNYITTPSFAPTIANGGTVNHGTATTTATTTSAYMTVQDTGSGITIMGNGASSTLSTGYVAETSAYLNISASETTMSAYFVWLTPNINTGSTTFLPIDSASSSVALTTSMTTIVTLTYTPSYTGNLIIKADGQFYILSGGSIQIYNDTTATVEKVSNNANNILAYVKGLTVGTSYTFYLQCSSAISNNNYTLNYFEITELFNT